MEVTREPVAIPEVVATILIQFKRESEESFETWTAKPESQSHPGDLSNLWLTYCYSDEDTKDKLESLLGLDGVQNVVVVYGRTTWVEYAAEHGLELGKHQCNHNGCKEFEGSAVTGEVLYYTGPL